MSALVTTPDPGLFGPDSLTWTVHSDPSMALAGLRALLLQALHPLAMAGVAQHSGFNDDPWGRLMRTADFVGLSTYGETGEVRRAAARIRGMHKRLAGIEPESGTPYRVNDPKLLLWVHCCEVESFLTTAVRSGLRLSRDEQDTYYAEQTIGATLVGLDEQDVPDSVDAMERYFAAVRPQLRVTKAARDAARFVLWPPMPTLVTLGTPARPAWVAMAAAAAAMLPRWAREMYGVPGIATSDRAATAAGLALRSGMLVLPERLLHGPHHRAARARMGLA